MWKIVFALVALVHCIPVQAQEKADFARLRSERQSALADLDSDKAKLRDAEDESRRLASSANVIESFIERNKADIEGAKRRLTEATSAKSSEETITRIRREIVDLESSGARAKRDLEDKIRVTKTVEELRAAVRVGERKLADVETRINEILARDVVAQQFKGQISAYFAGVVALMILGFFGIAFFDPVVRNNIFSGQSGIQFVTLFSIIISIILFGITGILGDKELSALLGGLSGYILGKYGNETKNATTSPAVASTTLESGTTGDVNKHSTP